MLHDLIPRLVDSVCGGVVMFNRFLRAKDHLLSGASPLALTRALAGKFGPGRRPRPSAGRRAVARARPILQVEALEPRLLLSADVFPVTAAEFRATPQIGDGHLLDYSAGLDKVDTAVHAIVT